MGNQVSVENEIDSFISSCINVMTEVSQDTNDYLNTDVDYVIENVKGNVDISHITAKQFISSQNISIQTSKQSAKVQQDISDLVTQTASAITQALSFQADDKEKVQNILNLVTELSENIQTDVSQQCMTNAKESQNITVKYVGGNVSITYVDVDQTIQAVTQCVQDSAADSDAYQKLIQQADQTASYVEKNILSFLGDYAWLIALILIVVLLITFEGVKSVTRPKFVVIVATLVLFYLSIAKFWNGFPYSKISKDKANKVWYGMMAGLILFFIIDVYMFKGSSK